MTSAERAAKLWESVTVVLRSTWIGLATEQIDAAVADALAARWILTTNRLPEHTRPVLVTIMSHAGSRLAPGPVTLEAYYSGGEWYRRNGSPLAVDVLAWQPMPDPWVAP